MTATSLILLVIALFLLNYPLIEDRARRRREERLAEFRAALDEWEFWMLNGRPKPWGGYAERLREDPEFLRAEADRLLR